MGTAHCTFAVTDAVPVIVNVQLLDLFPPLEQAPDQMASRPFETVSLIDVPVVNDAEPLLPTATLMPDGVDVMRSPLRPVAVTVSVAAWPGGLMVNVAVRVTLPALAVIVAADDVLTVVVEIVNVALVAPAVTVTFAGTVAAALLLESVTVNPPEAAAEVSVTFPCAALPPVTVEGLTEIAESAGDEGGGGGGGGGEADVLTVSDRAALSRSRAEIVMAVSDVTDEVVIGNVADATPAGTVTFAGTRAAAFELKS
jgi:hypothetical protein